MSQTLTGNAVVAQSGGPTAVINASACGLIQEASRHRSVLENIFGATNGILGIVQEELFDLGAESAETIEGLRRAPTSAIGTSGHMVSLTRSSNQPYQRGTGMTPLAEVANGVKKLPRSYMNAAGIHISAEMRRYALPLLFGQAGIQIGGDGLPEFVRFQRKPIPKKLPGFPISS